MLGVGGQALEDLQAAVREFRLRDERVDLKGLRSVIDSLERVFTVEARRLRASGDHLVDGNITAVSWIARTCSMSATSAADRLCVGEQLESLPRIASALGSGEVGYQSVSVLCHLREQLGDKSNLFHEEEMLELAQKHSVSTLRYLCRYARHVADPDGFQRESEEEFSRRRLHISQMGDGMDAIDGILDPEGGAALKTALETLARRLGPGDERSRSQRMADSLVELTQHAMDEGRLPRRNGVKPHLSVTTTLEGLKNELGAPAADLELAMPISTRSVERLACDCADSRVLLQDSVVIDVGRTTRVVSAPTRRALQVRDRGCRWPGCERPISWSTPHHIVAWSRGGGTNLNNLVLFCHHHHLRCTKGDGRWSKQAESSGSSRLSA
jgi:hypothetical protein